MHKINITHITFYNYKKVLFQAKQTHDVQKVCNTNVQTPRVSQPFPLKGISPRDYRKKRNGTDWIPEFVLRKSGKFLWRNFSVQIWGVFAREKTKVLWIQILFMFSKIALEPLVKSIFAQHQSCRSWRIEQLSCWALFHLSPRLKVVFVL